MNLSWKVVVALAAAGLPASIPAVAQAVISAKSGVVSYVEGQVTLDGETVEASVTRFPDLKENGVLQTTEGRAEVLLNPGVILRLGENSSVRMIVNRLIDTRIELATGSAVVEAMQVAKDTNVTVVVGSAMVSLPNAGIYRFDVQPAEVKVFKGTADVEMAGKVTPVAGGRVATLSGPEVQVAHFDTEATDDLDRWSHRRGAYMAMANVSSAYSQLASGSGYGYGSGFGYGSGYGYGYGYGYGSLGCSPNWSLNPWYGMMTYVPCNGYFDSPYGYTFFSPSRLLKVYALTGTYGWGHGNLGWAGGGASSGTAASAAAASHTSSPTWGAARGGIAGFSGGTIGRSAAGFAGSGFSGGGSTGLAGTSGGFSGGSISGGGSMGGAGGRGSGGAAGK